MINKMAPYINESGKWSGLQVASHASEGLMAITALKQYINIQNLQMPSMNYTHYVRFAKHPHVVLEWLINCNFFPLFFTGNSTDAEEACNAQFFVANLDDDVEGITERYLIQNHDLDAYKALIPADRITPHMILDFRGFGLAACKVGQDVVGKYIEEVCQYVKGVQESMDTYGDKWDIEKNHNPMITVLLDFDDDHCGYYLFKTNDVQMVHDFECYQSCKDLDWGWGTKARTYVKLYTNG